MCPSQSLRKGYLDVIKYVTKVAIHQACFLRLGRWLISFPRLLCAKTKSCDSTTNRIWAEMCWASPVMAHEKV